MLSTSENPIKTTFKKDNLVIFYFGILDKKTYLEEIVKLIGELYPNVIFRITGCGELYDFINEYSLTHPNIQFLDHLSKDEIINEISRCDIIFKFYSTHLYQVMMSGKPILALSGTIIGDIVTKDNCGIAINRSSSSFIMSMEKFNNPELRDILGNNGKKAIMSVEDEYKKDNSL